MITGFVLCAIWGIIVGWNTAKFGYKRRWSDWMTLGVISVVCIAGSFTIMLTSKTLGLP